MGGGEQKFVVCVSFLHPAELDPAFAVAPFKGIYRPFEDFKNKEEIDQKGGEDPVEEKRKKASCQSAPFLRNEGLEGERVDNAGCGDLVIPLILENSLFHSRSEMSGKFHAVRVVAL